MTKVFYTRLIIAHPDSIRSTASGGQASSEFLETRVLATNFGHI